MEFVSGFAWPVPKAFFLALSLCRFEEGDTFYNHPSAYEDPWGQTSSTLRYCVQVRFPPVSRAARRAVQDGAAAPDEEEHSQSAEDPSSVNAGSASPTGQRQFATNSWRSSAVVDISNLETRTERKAVATTQGRLYSLLWHGEISVLDSDGQPACPRSSQDLHAELPPLEDRIREAHGSSASSATAFVFAVDQVSTAHLQKVRSVQSALQKIAPVQLRTFDPSVFLGRARYFPTIKIQSFAVATTDRDRVHDALKALLYRPVKKSETGKDRFSLKKHGHLLSL
jgi:hypothetical protein